MPTSCGCRRAGSPSAAEMMPIAPATRSPGPRWPPSLVRALELAPDATNYFTDDNGNIHEANINALRGAGVTLGCNAEGTLFCPDDTVTRAQMASFLVRALGYPISGEDYFTDDNGNTHEDNINTLRANNVTLGCNAGGTLYCPNDSVRRDHMAAFLHRALG